METQQAPGWSVSHDGHWSFQASSFFGKIHFVSSVEAGFTWRAQECRAGNWRLAAATLEHYGQFVRFVCILPWYIVLIIVIIGQFKMFLSLSTFRGCRISYLQKYSPCQGQAETWRECQASISRANLTFGHLDLILLRILSIYTKTWRAGKS